MGVVMSTSKSWVVETYAERYNICDNSASANAISDKVREAAAHQRRVAMVRHTNVTSFAFDF